MNLPATRLGVIVTAFLTIFTIFLQTTQSIDEWRKSFFSLIDNEKDHWLQSCTK